MASPPPVSIGRYQVVRPIGQGGMGSLYLVWDPKLERQIAIKLLKDDDDQLRERFSREARAAARLRHPHIVTIFDVGDHDGQPFIAMEFVQGETMADIVRHRKDMPVARKVELIEELCDGLGFAHKAGIVHRDIKPANIMVDSEGSLKILDFGIARATESAGMTQAGMLIGTLNYMSPEQVAGMTVDHRSDIFAVGTVFYELLAFRQAFPGTILGGILNKIVHEAPDPLDELVEGLHPDIVRIVSRAIEKNPQDRYQDLQAMRKELMLLRMHLETAETPTQVILGPPAGGANRPSDPRMLTPKPTPTPGMGSGRRSADLEELSRRRATQIQTHLDEARAALAAENHEKAISACEQVLMLDANDPTGLELLDRARTALEARQARSLLDKAEDELARGSLTTAKGLVERAAQLDPNASKSGPLREVVDKALMERERARARAEAIQTTLARGQSSLEAGNLTAADRSADNALRIDPADADARAFKASVAAAREAQAREQLERRAKDVVREAQQAFVRGDHQAAVDMLARFEPRHDLVSRAAEQFRAEAARIAERRRAESEERARQERIEAEERARGDRIAAGLVRARQSIDQAEFAAAMRELRALEKAEGSRPEIQAALSAAEAAQRAADRAAAVGRELGQAADLRTKGDLKGALVHVEAALAINAAHESARALRATLQEAIREAAEREKAAERAARERQQQIAATLKKARRASSPDAAIVLLREVLDLDPHHAEARRLLGEQEDARERERRRLDRVAAADAVSRAEDAAESAKTVLAPAQPISAASAARSVPDPPAADQTIRLTRAQPAPVPDAPVITRPSPVPVPAPQPPAAARAAGASPLQTLLARPMYLGIAAAVFLVAVVGYAVFGGSSDTPPPGPGEPIAEKSPAPTATPDSTGSPTPPVVTASPSPSPTATPPPRPSPTAAGTPAPTASPKPTPTPSRFEAVRTLALEQYRAGDKTSAMGTAMEGWRLNDKDPQLVMLMQRLISDAQSDAMEARQNAEDAGRAATSTQAHKDGLAAQQSGDQLKGSSGSPDEVVRHYRTAKDHFEKALEESKKPTPTPQATTAPGPAGGARGAGTTGGAATPAAPPASTAADEASIKQVLREYEQGFDSRNVDAVLRVFPRAAAEVAELRRAYGNMDRQQVRLTNEKITINGARARVDCAIALSQKPKNSDERQVTGQTAFILQKTDGRWVIVSQGG